ncbi:OB-fold protein [Polaribacter aestuariivivens]|uniref:OB-fold protein n=1 Tax=Polaribacter aestuariivivens TaxID=2304626 RepID=UPI003F492D31
MKAKKIILSILILAVVGAIIAYKIYNKPHINVADENADITISASTILADFSSDEATANKKYLEKIIQVKGQVSDVSLSNGKGIVTLQTDDDFGSVICHLTDKESTKISEISKGQELIIKGICTGFLMDVILVKSIIINQQ